MVNPSGSVVINGVTDAELAHIFEVKSRNESTNFHFNPQQMNASQVNTPQGTQAINNNVVFGWQGEKALEIVHGILSFLLKKDEVEKAQGQ